MTHAPALQSREILTRKSTSQASRAARAARAGFSLIELLVVMFIIVLVISIVVPTLAKARQATKVTATSNLMSNLLTSAATFQQDERRLPGRYSGRDMGSDDNVAQGMTMTENAMLDLAGGVVQVGGAKPANGGIQVHPFNSTRAVQEGCWVDTGLIGQPSKSGKGYFVPDKKYFVQQLGEAQVGKGGELQDGQTYPDLVDAFGQPLLMWIEDESVVGKITGTATDNNFAKISSTGATSPARHYWNSNAGFLSSPKFGKMVTAVDVESLLGVNAFPADRPGTLTGLLGSLAAPSTLGSTTAATDVNQILPTASRGKILIQSAGPDGVFLSKSDKRGRGQFTSNAMLYGYNFIDPGSSKLRTDSAGKPEIVDVAGSFDDQIVAGGS